MHVYTCQHMKVFNMQFYMTCMFSRETSLNVLNMHVNCSNIAVIVVFIHVNICYIHCPVIVFVCSHVNMHVTCMLHMSTYEILNMHFYVT
jgi:hypothetical protein